jgi:DNA-binding PadR family transcriptional regulator
MAGSRVRVGESAYFVLASLADGPLYGYAIIRSAQQLSDGRVRLTTGALYAELDRLSRAGYVRRGRHELAAGRVRRCYGLTGSGLTCLHAEASRKAVAAGLVMRAPREMRVRRIVTIGGRVRLGGNGAPK